VPATITFPRRFGRPYSSPGSKLIPFFAPWNARPDWDRVWRAKQEATLLHQAVLCLAPETPEDVLAGDETAVYIPAEIWDDCYDPLLEDLQLGDRTPLVLGVDALVTGDKFAVVAISRHPRRPVDPAMRACRIWDPADTGGRIDFDELERFICFTCKGGCPSGHPKSMPDPNCNACRAKNFSVPRHNVVRIVYDPYQMEEMVQRLRRDGIWCKEFPQGEARLIADGQMHKLALRKALAHNGARPLREHVLNARAKLSKDEDSKMRMVKRSPNKKIDLAVAASMAVYDVLYLNL
jgi:phage terminase large subunit-like protein